MTERDYIAAYETDYSRVLRYVQRLGPNPEAAEDIVQSAWAKAWEKRHSFRGACTIRVWVCAIARNIACSKFRHYQPEQLKPFVHDIPMLPCYEHKLDLEKVLQRCPAKEVALLVEWAGGSTYPAIAKEQRVTPMAVRMRLYRTRLALRHKFAA